MKTLLVTGGLGFIGSNFIRGSLNSGFCERVLNLDKQTYAGNPENLVEFARDSRYEFVLGDIGDAKLVSAVLEESKPDALVNFAAESHVDRSIDGPEPFVQTNVLGTLHLLEACREHLSSGILKKDFRFLHVSTDEVYGSLGPEDQPFCEKTPYAPNSPYSASKAAVDHLTRTMALEGSRHGIRVNAIAPGYFKTAINDEFLDSEAGQRMAKRVPMRRFGDYEELSGPLLLLASDQGSYMTGSTIVVDGGHTLVPL